MLRSCTNAYAHQDDVQDYYEKKQLGDLVFFYWKGNQNRLF